ncbi:MAG: glycosyl hydrolase family 57 [Candidatus Omnitrophica bacterium]|nr:glycosyl hydrolase family 57 [Candidatus Omnitrophota bacterium]MDD5429359.1 glycosyl hydrolase family 57 [Candidatus Omnitrophota bacterium]
MDGVIKDFPDICSKAAGPLGGKNSAKKSFACVDSNFFKDIESSFGLALHMHQPTIPAAGQNLHTAGLISNLQYMMEHPDIGDNHNASVFFWCYWRMADFIQELVDSGHYPRIMLDYSGNLLWGLSQIEGGKALEKLKSITQNKKYYPCVEWLGTMWSHSVVSSTPVPDIILHIRAWQSHFSSIFGQQALSRVKGFSPPEMHLPIHPDVCFEYVKALKACGYQWLMVQEHTVENLNGSPIARPHFPHKLIARNSDGEAAEITVLIKTQGSDTKLVAQMQPFYEAKTRQLEDYASKTIPAFVLQISDGENGGVMMNEFPDAYKRAFEQINTRGTVALNGSQYLALIESAGIQEKDFIAVQPVSQHKIWEFFESDAKMDLALAISKAKEKYPGFSLEKASWTSDRNWVKGYKDVIGPINSLSIAFHKKADKLKFKRDDEIYRQALTYLLLSQTSCFRYWGSGIWTEYAKEICRRGQEIIKNI